MTIQNISFKSRLSALSAPAFKRTLLNIRHGIERETLRVNPDGSIATNAHPKALGAALTHEWITTDFSESLLEFITPPENNFQTSLEQLVDIHKFTYESIGEQFLWPMSMPCFINSDTKIPIARYGTSNVAKMKEVYRQGLHNRYGSMMQVIAGVHFNFSLPDEFWLQWCELHGETWNKTTQSAHYFSLVRNFRRFAWIIPYLFGASPALCSSFVAHKKVHHDFKKVGKGTLYMPYATSLRMSDLGYTSSAQSSLKICYNDLTSYVSSLRSAIGQKAPEYSHLGCDDENGWQQLNDNILQIENELYSPIRPKQVAKSLEMPANALEDRGVSYLEVRSLDVNPYSPIGIDAEQFHFLDVFLLFCLLEPSAKFERSEFVASQENVTKTVTHGRDKALTLDNNGEQILLSQWGKQLSDRLTEVAVLLDDVNNTDAYLKAVNAQAKKFADSRLTPSGRWLQTLLDNDIDNSMLGLELAKQYKKQAEELSYMHIQKDSFIEQAAISLSALADIELADDQDFASFIEDYFAQRVKDEVSENC